MRALQPGEAFQVGEVWTSPRGTVYRVMQRTGGFVILRGGAAGTGPKVKRPWDAVMDWVRVAGPGP